MKEGDEGWEWRYSWQKELLMKELRNGTITADMKPRHVYNMREEYATTSRKRFGPRLGRCRVKNEENQILANADEVGLAHDRTLFPKKTQNVSGTPIWHGSDAEAQLDQLIKEATYAPTMKPKALQQTNQAFQEFEGKVFRNHIYQRVKTLKYYNYRNDKKKKNQEPVQDTCQND